jgi:crossover junction endodeoxyribonuclease RuvC
MKTIEWQNVMQLFVNYKGGERMRFIGIDPSTKTGFVAIDELGQVVRAKELTGIGDVDPKRMITLIDEIMAHIQPNDFIVIEGFSYGSQGQGVAFQYGLGHGIRMALHRRGFTYIEVSPNAVKKFATGKGNTKKDEMVLPIFKLWGFEHSSDNLRDAFVLARIALALNGYDCLYKYQTEVITSILEPKPKTKKEKGKK